MDTRPLATPGAVGAAHAAVSRCDLGQWGVDSAAQGSGIGKPVCGSPARGGRGR